MMAGIEYKEFKKQYDVIRSRYPETLAWIKHKASWECIPLMAVMNEYKGTIEMIMRNEDRERSFCGNE